MKKIIIFSLVATLATAHISPAYSMMNQRTKTYVKYFLGAAATTALLYITYLCHTGEIDLASINPFANRPLAAGDPCNLITEGPVVNMSGVNITGIYDGQSCLTHAIDCGLPNSFGGYDEGGINFTIEYTHSGLNSTHPTLIEYIYFCVHRLGGSCGIGLTTPEGINITGSFDKMGQCLAPEGGPCKYALTTGEFIEGTIKQCTNAIISVCTEAGRTLNQYICIPNRDFFGFFSFWR